MISVLIVTHNSEATLERCLASLPWQGPNELEVIVADNASSDGTREIVRRFSRARWLEMGGNLGFGIGNNRAAEAAGGELFLLLNSDAWLEHGCLETLAARLEREPSLGLVAPRLFYPDGRPQCTWEPDVGVFGELLRRLRNTLRRREWMHEGGARLLRALTGPGWLTAACVLVRRRAFEQVGGFDPDFFLYFEDVDLGLRLRRRGWRCDWEPAARAIHASAGGERGGLTEREYRRSQLLYYRKHRPRWERALLRAYLRRLYARSGKPMAPEIRAAIEADAAVPAGR